MGIEEILKKLFGKIEPVGETNEDERRFKNIQNYYQALCFIITQLKFASKYKDRKEYSMQKIGKECFEILEEIGLESED